MSLQKIIMSSAGSSSPYYILQGTNSSGESVSGQGVAKDSAGNYYVIGNATYSTTYESNVLLVKYTPTGILVWQKTLNIANGTGYGGEERSYGYCVAIDSSDNIYVSGTADKANPSYYYCFLAKYNTSGTLQWQKKYTYQYDWSIGLKIAIDFWGSIYLLIRNSRTKDGFVAQFDSSGNLVTRYRINNQDGSSAWESNAMTLDSSARVYFAGMLRLNGTDTKPYPVIACWSNAGVLQWQRMLTGFTSGQGSYQAMCSDSTGIYVTGRITQTDTCVIVKYDGSGNILWQRQLNMPSASATSMKVASDGFIYIALGYGYLLKIDSSGTLQWQRRFYASTSSTYSNLYDLIVDGDKIVAVGDQYYPSYMVLLNVPTDGTFTGTYAAPSGYGNYLYQTTNFTMSTPTYTNTTSALTSSLTNTDFTLSNAVLIAGTGAITSTKTSI